MCHGKWSFLYWICWGVNGSPWGTESIKYFFGVIIYSNLKRHISVMCVYVTVDCVCAECARNQCCHYITGKSWADAVNCKSNIYISAKPLPIIISTGKFLSRKKHTKLHMMMVVSFIYLQFKINNTIVLKSLAQEIDMRNSLVLFYHNIIGEDTKSKEYTQFEKYEKIINLTAHMFQYHSFVIPSEIFAPGSWQWT